MELKRKPRFCNQCLKEITHVGFFFYEVSHYHFLSTQEVKFTQVKMLFPLQESFIADSSAGRWMILWVLLIRDWLLTGPVMCRPSTGDSVAVRPGLQWLCHAYRVAFVSPSLCPPALTFFFLISFLGCFRSLREGNTQMLFRDEHSAVTYSQHFEELWVSVFSSTHCTERFLSLKPRVASVYKYRHGYL